MRSGAGRSGSAGSGRALLLALLCAALPAGCDRETAGAIPEAPIFVESAKVKRGEPILLHAPLDTELPEVPGLSAEPAGVDAQGRGIWRLSGADGSYILTFPQPGASTDQPQTRLFVDIGVPGPQVGEIGDLVAPPPPPPPIWPWIAALAAFSASVIAGTIWAWRRFQPKPAPSPPEPAWRIAQREWRAIRDRGDLSPEQLALELSAVYRRFLEVSHGWPATSRTTREILESLEGEMGAPALACAKRLLGAMDLVKFSDRSTHARFFETLDEDFHQLVRPQAGREGGP